MKIYKKKEVIENTCTGFICDVCKKDFNNEGLIEVTTGHDDWGNDSIDSVEKFDICSLNCLLEGIKKGSIKFTTSRTSYFEIDGNLSVEELKDLKEK